MFESVYNWYKIYPSTTVFLQHKLTHVAWGVLWGAVFTYFGYWYIGAGFVLITGIGKEIADEYQDGADNAQTTSMHVLDVLVTCLGGVVGIVIGFLLL